MDKITDIFDNVKERLSNPFLFSFLISWLVLNWKISVSLIWFDEKQISANGCKSIFDFIEDQLLRNHKFWTPFFIALSYTFIMPYFKELVDFINKKAIIFGQEWKTKLLKNDLQLKINDLESKLVSVSDSSLLDGNWNIIYYIVNNQGGAPKEHLINVQVYISNRDFYIIEKDSRKIKFHISEFYFNPLNNSMLFYMKNNNVKMEQYVNFLDGDVICNLKLVNGYLSNLEGFHNNYKVEYKKI